MREDTGAETSWKGSNYITKIICFKKKQIERSKRMAMGMHIPVIIIVIMIKLYSWLTMSASVSICLFDNLAYPELKGKYSITYVVLYLFLWDILY